jgi:hypothetical protein
LGEAGREALVRRGEVFNGEIACRYPSATIHFTNASPKLNFSLIFRFISGRKVIQYNAQTAMVERGK